MLHGIESISSFNQQQQPLHSLLSESYPMLSSLGMVALGPWTSLSYSNLHPCVQVVSVFLSPLGKVRSEPLASFSVPTLPLAWTAVSLRQAVGAG